MEVTERKSTKINLKKLIENLIVAHDSGDTEEVESQKGHFEWFMESSMTSTKITALNYISNHRSVKERKFLRKYFTSFSMSK